MKNIAIVYFSKTGLTDLVAHQISKGVKHAKANATLFEIEPKHIVEGRFIQTKIFEQLNEYHAIVFGSPTYMGSAAAQYKAFMDASSDSYTNKEWNGKLAAGFTTGGAINGEQQQTLLSFFALACQHGMIWAGLDTSQFTDQKGLNRTGSSIGLVSSCGDVGDSIDENDLRTAFYFGHRLAEVTQRLG
jgi:multimeric flavodoxin WrbA